MVSRIFYCFRCPNSLRTICAKTMIHKDSTVLIVKVENKKAVKMSNTELVHCFLRITLT